MPKQPVYQKGKGPIIGGPLRTNIFDRSDDEDAPPSDKQQKQPKQQQQATKQPKTKVVSADGTVWAEGGKGKKKPLPGRLRKKLAKEKFQK